MRPVTALSEQPARGTRTAPRLWGLTGLVTIAALAASLIWLLAVPGTGQPEHAYPVSGRVVSFVLTRTVTSVQVSSRGVPVQISAGNLTHVQVTEIIGGGPQDSGTVSGGVLTLGGCARACGAVWSYQILVPAGTAVSADTSGGPLTMTGLDGAVRASTAGGSVHAAGLTSASVTIYSGGGPADVSFAQPPRRLVIGTSGGSAVVMLPGGPYAISADSGGGPELISVLSAAGASDRAAITTGGGPLRVGRAAG